MTESANPGLSIALFAAWMRLRAWLVTLMIAAASGAVAHAAGAPLAWMLGALFGTLLLKATRREVKVPAPLTTLSFLILGVHIGTTVETELFGRLTDSWPSIALLVAVVLAGTFATAWLLRRVLGLDPVRALCSATPGGVSVMAVVAEDEQLGAQVSLAQSVRVVVVVAFVALLAPLIQAPDAGPPRLLVVGGPLDLLVLAGCVALGWAASRFAPFSGARLIYPLLIAMAASLLGLSDGTFPGFLVAGAQIVFGASLGTRWNGTWEEFRTAAAAGTLAAVSLLAISAAAATLMYFALGGRLPFLTLWLAFSPGGLYEMTLLAGALGADLGFVAAHHLFRLLLILGLAPRLARSRAEVREPARRARDTEPRLTPISPAA